MARSQRKITRKKTQPDSARTYSVLIVDDHELLRVGLRAVIQADPCFKVCGEAAELSEGRRLLKRFRPDIAVVDLKLGDQNGLELVKYMKDSKNPPRIVVCSMHDEKLYGERALHAGASGYVNKLDSANTIVTAIRQILDGKLYFSEQLVNRMLMRAMSDGQTKQASPVDLLSDRELEVFRLVGQGHTSREIAQVLHLSGSTVDTYRERLKSKLGLANGVELTHEATRWVLEND